jgi:hypothetical protein
MTVVVINIEHSEKKLQSFPEKGILANNILVS